MHVKFTHRKYNLKVRCDVEQVPTIDQHNKISEEIRKEIDNWEKEYGKLDWGDFQAICHIVLEKYIPIKHNTLVTIFEF